MEEALDGDKSTRDEFERDRKEAEVIGGVSSLKMLQKEFFRELRSSSSLLLLVEFMMKDSALGSCLMPSDILFSSRSDRCAISGAPSEHTVNVVFELSHVSTIVLMFRLVAISSFS